VQILRRVAVLLAAIGLSAPAVALAQTGATATVPQGQGVSTQPPVQLSGDDPPAPPPAPAPAQPPAPPPAKAPPTARAHGGELPNTGTDPRLLFGVGVALTLLGVGLRLRTADAELY
jgi:LPXTG-motif cell wall-anchored protein